MGHVRSTLGPLTQAAASFPEGHPPIALPALATAPSTRSLLIPGIISLQGNFVSATHACVASQTNTSLHRHTHPRSLSPKLTIQGTQDVIKAPDTETQSSYSCICEP